jgi:hypothetical protein
MNCWEPPQLQRKIAHCFGCLSGQLSRLLWDTGCSDELITPTLARQLIQKGCRWEYIEPVAIGHGNTEAITSGPPSTLRVMLDLLIVHNGNVFQKPDVWFLVYEGCLLDAMISDEMLNTIPCLTCLIF